MDESHEKYCRLSKFENRLCDKVNGANTCTLNGGGWKQVTSIWEVCPVPSQQVEVKVEVIEKDLVDQVIDNHFPSISTPYMEGVTRQDFREIIDEYVKRVEAERKPLRVLRI